jgi:mRNA-degrading endonuclease RelE of RelBE toxin-antitoxin system
VGDDYAVPHRPEAVTEDLPGVPRLWKLRVGDYRVCYEIQGSTVTVWAIRNRPDVYAILHRRRPA